MADISTITKAELIKDLPTKSSISPTDLYLLQTSVQSFKLPHDTLVSSLVDDNTIEANSSKLRIKNNAVDLTKLADIDASTTGKVIGKTSGSGDPEYIDIDTDLTAISSTHNTLASAKAVKDYTDTQTFSTINKGLGYNQTWKVSPSNGSIPSTVDTWGSWNYNNTNRPIFLNISAWRNAQDSFVIHVEIGEDGFNMVLVSATNTGGGVLGTNSFIVPPNTRYRFKVLNHALTSFNVWELS